MTRTRRGRWTLCQRYAMRCRTCDCATNAGGGKLKNQMKRADASGATWALIVGEDEVANNEITLEMVARRRASGAVVASRADRATGRLDRRREVTVSEYMNDDDRVLVLRRWWEGNGTIADRDVWCWSSAP